MTGPLMPKKGEIYRLLFKGKRCDVLVESADIKTVSFAILGWGTYHEIGLYEFCSHASFVEDRIQRLRRACRHYKLKETDEWLKENLLKS